MATQIFVERHTIDSSEPEILVCATLPTGSEAITLQIEGAGRDHSFSYRLENGEWLRLGDAVDGSILSTHAAGGFVGTLLGLYARKP